MTTPSEKFRGRKIESLTDAEWRELILLSMELQKALPAIEIIRKINILLSGKDEEPMQITGKPPKPMMDAIFFYFRKGKIRSVEGARFNRIEE